MAGTCERGNDTSDSIKCGEFLDLLRNCLLLKKESAPWSVIIFIDTMVTSAARGLMLMNLNREDCMRNVEQQLAL